MEVSKVKKVYARQILDSRGVPTVEVDVWSTAGGFGRASVPSGASTGSKEAIELRDNNPNRFLGKSVLKAVDNVNTKLAKAVVGMEVSDQKNIDAAMLKLDGTDNKSKLGANAILGVSLACAKAAAADRESGLYKKLGTGVTLPMPMMNVINGGKHADNNLNIQEFMIVPVGAQTFAQALEWCTTVFHTLKSILKSKGLSTVVGDEGGFAPDFKSDEQALKFIMAAIERAGFVPGQDFGIALDVAASEMFAEAVKRGKRGGYFFWKSRKFFTGIKLLRYYEKLVATYPIISIEDGFDENDWQNWIELTARLGDKIQIVGDDLFVTNTKLLQQGIQTKAANAILIKLNQIGTITETLETIKMARKAGFATIISHRSGETEDNYIADLAVATDALQIKTGAPSRSDRVAKYNQLLRIEEELGKKAKFAKKSNKTLKRVLPE